MNNKPIYFIIGLIVAAALVVGFLVQWRSAGFHKDDLVDRIGAWVGAICVIAIFSYLYRENPFYRSFEHVLLGVGLGFGAAIVVRQVLYEQWWIPMSTGFRAIYYGVASPGSIWDACLVFSGFFGLLWYFQYSKKYLWLSRITIGITVGAGAGLGIKRTLIETLPQITSTFKNLYVRPGFAPHLTAWAQWFVSFKNLLFLVIVCCVLYYFFFSFRRESSLSKAPANMGRFFLMISFGAFFGNTFMTRVIILIDRVQFLLHDWLLVQ